MSVGAGFRKVGKRLDDSPVRANPALIGETLPFETPGSQLNPIAFVRGTVRLVETLISVARCQQHGQREQ
jgi:hypothetical protein